MAPKRVGSGAIYQKIFLFLFCSQMEFFEILLITGAKFRGVMFRRGSAESQSLTFLLLNPSLINELTGVFVGSLYLVISVCVERVLSMPDIALDNKVGTYQVWIKIFLKHSPWEI